MQIYASLLLACISTAAWSQDTLPDILAKKNQIVAKEAIVLGKPVTNDWATRSPKVFLQFSTDTLVAYYDDVRYDIPYTFSNLTGRPIITAKLLDDTVSEYTIETKPGFVRLVSKTGTYVLKSNE